MEFGKTILGAVIGGVIGSIAKKNVTTYALWGGGIGFAATLVTRSGGAHAVGDLPFVLPTPALPGQMDYTLDPRTDPRLDPVSREHLYPAWLLAHYQQGDRKIVAQVQRMLGLPGDGVIGGGTTAAIRAYQMHNGLQTAGIMDIATMQALILG